MPGTNTLAYLPPLSVMKEKKFYDIDPQVAFKDRINRRAQEKIEEQLEEARFVFVAENKLECSSIAIVSARRGIFS